jgi:penicillin-binding protein 1B
VPDLQPRTVIAPLIPLVLVAVLGAFAVVVALVLLPIFGAAGVGVNAFRERLDAAGVGQVRIPDFPETSTIYAADGTVLAEIFLDENRRYVKIHKVAQVAQDAVIAIEDDSFYEHGALNFPSLIRAAIANLVAGEIEQGGSTLTQQLVKSYFLDNRRTLGRKIEEAMMAWLLEVHFEKQDLMNAYINEIYLGQDGNRAVHGFGLASQFYFGKPLAELQLHEVA